MNDFEENVLDKINKNLFFFYYQGSFLSRPGINILDVLEKNIESVLTKKITKRAFFFGIEMIQNIEKYSANSPDITDSISLVKDDKGIQLISENAVFNSDIDKLKAHIDKVSSSSKEELEELYFERLKKTLNDGSKSPGLGLIELNRRGDNQLKYSFEKVTEEYSNFKLHICMFEDNEDQCDEDLEVDLYELVKSEYKEKKAAIFYSGLFNNKLLLPLIDFIEGLELIKDETLVSKYQHCIIEMIQNANEHGKNKNGVGGFFSLLQTSECICTACCNLVDKNAGLVELIDDLNSKTFEELKQLNRQKLMDFGTDGGLGFIQLAQYLHPSPLKSKNFYLDEINDFFYIESRFLLNDS